MVQMVTSFETDRLQTFPQSRPRQLFTGIIPVLLNQSHIFLLLFSRCRAAEARRRLPNNEAGFFRVAEARKWRELLQVREKDSHVFDCETWWRTLVIHTCASS